MIVSMKKIAVIIQGKDALEALQRLRLLGVVHVEHQRPPQNKEINALQEDNALINEAIRILSAPEFSGVRAGREEKKSYDWKVCARHIVDSYKRLDQLQEYSFTLLRRIAEWEPWGDFNPQDITALAKKDIFIRLYQIPAKEIKNVPASAIVKTVYTRGGLAYCAVITRQKIDIPFKEVALPKMNPSMYVKRLNTDAALKETIKKDIMEHARFLPDIIRFAKTLSKEVEFAQALGGMGQQGSLTYLTGYVPVSATGLLETTARQAHWGLLITEPASDDMVPTLLRNPRWVALVEPVFKFVEIIPGYTELDISFWFLIFFSIFFGMLIGDAGVGLVFVILTAIAQRKARKKGAKTSIFILFHILSLCAIIWGVLTGTFFGQEWLPKWVKPLVPALRNDKTVQTLCFLLGVVHLTIAHSWRAILKFPALAALAEVGWISILWAGFFLARVLVLGETFPRFGPWLIAAGSILVIFFSSPNKNILKCIGAGLGNYLLSVVNSFTDIVSYIRLFAVGLASVAVADAFNAMALSIGYTSIVQGILASLVLLVGQSLNIVLGPMSVLVHGLRLNVLEFCGHLGIQWSGFLYRPLREETVNLKA